ncbi:arylsulfatase [Pontibacter sp. G13]|uniref:arylsulfatase n=1 Tax=Pontibacter sp. G13 TaxID=3074898 RepID=UPI00288C11D4|nr:arylsulfatase [Pontibacter sp. G13]WNJ19126.1 arylsulfatase [Pontibacter sp. G13]
MFRKFLLILTCWIGGHIALAQSNDRPNVILVFVDDLGYHDLHAYGQQEIETPNLDRMAKEGIKFSQCYAGSAVCAPSRHSLMTGLHTGHTKVRHNINQLPLGQMPLDSAAFTMAEMFKEKGYNTAAIGKWAMGAPGNSGDPLQQGFDYFMGYYCQCKAHNYFPEMLWRNGDTVSLANVCEPVEVPFVDYPLSYATEKVEYSPDLMFQEVKDFIGRQTQRKPFFLYYAATLPHSNGEAPEDERFEVPDWGQYADKDWEPKEKGYAAMVSKLDAQMGELMELLTYYRIEKKTLVVFTSDNGPTNFAQRFWSSGFFRGKKRSLYEGGIRVPMIAWMPGTIPERSIESSVTVQYDLFPTFAELIQVKSKDLPQMDGVSLLHTMKTGKDLKDRVCYWEIYEGPEAPARAIRKGEWKLLQTHIGDEEQERTELYRIPEDPEEYFDLKAVYPEVVRDLTEEIERQHTPYEWVEF